MYFTGRGVLLLVSKLIECCIIEDLYCYIMDYIDIISIKIIINSNDFKIVSSVYRSPDYNMVIILLIYCLTYLINI